MCTYSFDYVNIICATFTFSCRATACRKRNKGNHRTCLIQSHLHSQPRFPLFFGIAIDATANRNVLYIWIRGTTRHNWRRRRPKERDGIIVIKEKHRADIYTIYIRCEGYLRRKFDWYALHICEAHTHTAAGNPFCTNWQLKRKT